MRVELLAVGSELLLGDIVNTNASWLGQRLAAAGIDVERSVAVGDNIARIVDCLRTALQRADGVIVTGGLGPTQDDLTREALAAVAGVELRRDPGLELALRDRFANSGRMAPERNYRQADVPAGAIVLPNAVGTAPGLRLEVARGVLYALPGVPREMTAMYDAEVAPDLSRRVGRPAVLVSRVIHTAGIWESEVAEAVADLVDRLEARGNPTLAFLAAGGQTRVRITAKAENAAAASALIEPVEAQVRAALGPAVYGVDDATLDAAVHLLLRRRGETVAVAESLTGGLLGAALSAEPGASESFLGGITAYSTPLKAVLLDVGVPVLAQCGPVSAEVASAMAAGVRRRLDATYGLALTGVAGPQEQDGQLVGTVFAALASPGGGVVRPLRLGRAGAEASATLSPSASAQDRERIRTYAVVATLDLLRRHLIALPAPST